MPDENSEKYLQGESADGQWDKLPGKHFTIKRIQEWVNDLQHCSQLEESNETSVPNDQVKRDFEGLNGPTAIKVDGKVTTGVEAVKKYIHISFLSASATTVQQSNLRSVAIRFFQCICQPQGLNQSGNAICMHVHWQLYPCAFIIYYMQKQCTPDPRKYRFC